MPNPLPFSSQFSSRSLSASTSLGFALSSPLPVRRWPNGPFSTSLTTPSILSLHTSTQTMSNLSRKKRLKKILHTVKPRFPHALVSPPPSEPTNTIVDEKPNNQRQSSKIPWHRLMSIEDPLWVHKLSSIVFLLSSLILIIMFPYRAIILHELSIPPPSILNPILLVWAPSCTVQAVTGAVMACQYRNSDRKSRDVFINNSVMTLIDVWVVVKLCIDLPAPFNSDLLSEGIMSVLTVTVVVMTSISVYHAPSLICNRNRTPQTRSANPNPENDEKTANMFSVSWIFDYINYIFPFFYPLPFIIGSFFVFVGHDSAWIKAQCQEFPNVSTVALYVNVGASFTVGMISLLVTLRDRKMVSKRTESIGISMISILLTAFLFETFRVLVGVESIHVFLPHLQMFSFLSSQK